MEVDEGANPALDKDQKMEDTEEEERQQQSKDDNEAGKGKQVSSKKSVFDEELLRVYYARLFPHDAMFRWLSYGNDPDRADEQSQIDSDYFMRREFSFTMADDVYIRYLCFRDASEFRQLIERKNPHKIDIGPLYTLPPKNNKSVKAAAFKPVERELVFDIDLTDYDEVRLGCTPDMMWDRGSWLYMSVAMKIVDEALREDFGFEHLVWIFSGRRGVHCWVSDKRARQLEDKERKAVVDYLTLIVGNENAAQRVQLSHPLHPEIFDKMVLSPEGQDILCEKSRWDKVLKLIPNKELRARLDSAWASDDGKDSRFRWKQLKATTEDEIKRLSKDRSGGNKKTIALLRKVVPTILIVFCYPRLDVNVSTHRNHLLKSPFVIHPKTGKVCVPILDVANADAFDPNDVPTLPKLADEINAADPNMEGPLYLQTSMKPYLEGFEKQFLKPLYNTIKREWREANEKLAAESGDW
ncbi:DNA primase small subunit [Hondaea fermentalgiana]|uniref:DNA primase n=1 Tax=Hondaea fermentalgiana TaxID=2315210 RepID=A0A2R5GPH6_9STRA|nr:DNA primase small subunit [Hondaea fermentalgiana]|eukprot:GBG30523.1 DNA primase small subunit [Hondaea fermentalgiana]